MRKSQRLPERKSTSCLASTRKCCPAMRGVEPSASPPPSTPWHDAQWSKCLAVDCVGGRPQSAVEFPVRSGRGHRETRKQQGARKSKNDNLHGPDSHVQFNRSINSGFHLIYVIDRICSGFQNMRSSPHGTRMHPDAAVCLAARQYSRRNGYPRERAIESRKRPAIPGKFSWNTAGGSGCAAGRAYACLRRRDQWHRPRARCQHERCLH